VEFLAVRTASETAHIVAASVGFLSFFLLWLTVMWGITLRSGWALTTIRHHTLYGTHMTLSLFGLALGIVHAAAQMATGGGPVGLIDEFVPFTNDTDPIGVGFGTIALEIFVALPLSVLFQKKLGYHRWRGMHALAYVAFTLVTAHLLISGSEVSPFPPVSAAVAGAWVITVLMWIASAVGANKVPKVMGGEKVAASRARTKSVTVNVDPSHCVRFGFCEHEAPEVFQLRNDGRLTYKAQVPQDEVERVIQAAQVCPARAIKLSRIPTTVVMSGANATQSQSGNGGGAPAAETAPVPRLPNPRQLRSERGGRSGPTRLGDRRGGRG
jgi:sulfoxide reductase heme-binding subunit YedZ